MTRVDHGHDRNAPVEPSCAGDTAVWATIRRDPIALLTAAFLFAGLLIYSLPGISAEL